MSRYPVISSEHVWLDRKKIIARSDASMNVIYNTLSRALSLFLPVLSLSPAIITMMMIARASKFLLITHWQILKNDRCAKQWNSGIFVYAKIIYFTDWCIAQTITKMNHFTTELIQSSTRLSASTSSSPSCILLVLRQRPAATCTVPTEWVTVVCTYVSVCGCDSLFFFFFHDAMKYR